MTDLLFHIIRVLLECLPQLDNKYLVSIQRVHLKTR